MIVYCRTENPANAEAMEQQKLNLVNYATEKGYSVVGISEENGSAMTCDRATLNKIEEIAGKDEFDVLIAERGDKVAEVLSEYYKYSTELKSVGVDMDFMIGLDLFGKDIELFKDAPRSEERPKPNCELIGQDGNIFNLLGIAQRTLRQNGMDEQAKEMFVRINAEAHDYYHALGIIGEYVNITGPEDKMDMEDMSL